MENNDPLTEAQFQHAQALKDFVPDLRNIGRHQDGFATELGSSDADKIKQAIEAAQRKPVSLEKRRSQNRPVVHTIAGYRVSHPLRDDARIGWTAFSDAINPGGSLHIAATEKKQSDELVLLNENWQDYGVIFIIGVGFWVMAKWSGSMGIFVCCLLFVGKGRNIIINNNIANFFFFYK